MDMVRIQFLEERIGKSCCLYTGGDLESLRTGEGTTTIESDGGEER